MSTEEELLFARGEELLGRARSGEITNTVFLTPGERKKLETHFSFAPGEWLFFGGYREAERTRMFFLPDYAREEEVREIFLAESFSETLCAVSVTGSGYRDLTHRDFLGSVLHLGLAREAVGDICVLSPRQAVIFCGRLTADFLPGELTFVGGDKVKTERFTPPPDFDGGRRFESVCDTVASPRADAVVAALCHLSREKAQALFTAGQIEADYEILEKNEKPLQAGTVLTVHGYGKFVLRELSEPTRKGRIRLRADRYV